MSKPGRAWDRSSFHKFTQPIRRLPDRKATVAPLPAPDQGTFKVTLDFTTFGRALTVSTLLSLPSGASPIYVSVVGL